MAAALVGLSAVGAVAPAGPATAADSSRQGRPHAFDLQAHRGGLGLVVENTLASFSNALETGVSTLELDVQITKDGKAVVTHDRRIAAAKCRDTGPAYAGDPQYPYVGKYIAGLTFAQVRTLDCGTRTLPQYPGQRPSPGAKMPLLSEVFALVERYRAHKVTMNVETKVEAGAPHETAPREQFVRVVANEVRRAGVLGRVTVQSFDWGALMRMRQVEPRLPIVALTNGQQFLQAGMEGRSPWLGGLDIDDFDGDLVAATKSFGADAVSPVHGDPQGGTVNDPGYEPYVTRAMVARAHAAGMKVVPWTVNDTATMNKLIDDGVDGIITDYPDRLRTVMSDHGFKLPKAYRAPSRPGAAA
ncbi:glycerophosphodiester phosphodiesterase [Streptomyces sp. Wb2n-11]|uniref:glycerophosphodiester phosphodiesterase n=1 Tax=Streptomyces sp. Wb2n-11 TaxID=1030533 RepID=UPI000A9D32E7|nr:glycerophosphodiester phosphodiesterase [Streptomyces sp. Wb2n-11]